MAGGTSSAGGVGNLEGPRPDHDPIEITSDADLLTPDTVADDDGVRSGTGTADDPFVIRNWRISSDEDDGIYVLDTTLHLVIEDVTIVQETPREESAGVFLEDARNVTIRNVTISGVHDYGVFSRGAPNLPIRGVNISIVPDGDIYEFGIFVVRGSAEIESSAITLGTRSGADGTVDGAEVGIKCQRARIAVRDVSIGSFPAFFSSTTPPSGNRCDNIVFEGNQVVPFSGQETTGFFDAGNEVTIRENLGPAVYHATVRDGVRRAIVEGNEIQALELEGTDGVDLDDNKEVEIRQNRFNGQCSEPSACRTVGLRIQDSVHVPVKIVGNRFEGYHAGKVLEIAGVPFNATGNAFIDNFRGPDGGTIAVVESRQDLAAEAKDSVGAYQVFDKNDLLRHPGDHVGRAIEYRGSAESLTAERNYWGPQSPEVCRETRPTGCDEPQPRWSIQGNVDVDPWSTTPNVLSESFVESYFSNYDTGNLLPAPHPFAALTALAGAALLGRRLAG